MRRSTIWQNKALRTGIAVLFWLAVWQTVSLCTPKLLFASPGRTAAAFCRLAGRVDFWQAIFGTMGSIVAGFLLGFLPAIACAVLCRRFALPRLLLEPMVQVMKSVPVACFVVVALIWMRSQYLSVLVSCFVVFPVTYIHLSAAIGEMDATLTEMLVVFRVPKWRRICMAYVPQLVPGLLAVCRITVGMCWKAGVAGELIGLPAHSIGEQLYLAKLYLAVDELFVWSAVLILVSLALEKLVAKLLQRLQERLEAAYAN